TAIYSLSLHDALPIWKRVAVEEQVPLLGRRQRRVALVRFRVGHLRVGRVERLVAQIAPGHVFLVVRPVAVRPRLVVDLTEPRLRSEEHTSELQSRSDL